MVHLHRDVLTFVAQQVAPHGRALRLSLSHPGPSNVMQSSTLEMAGVVSQMALCWQRHETALLGLVNGPVVISAALAEWGELRGPLEESIAMSKVERGSALSSHEPLHRSTFHSRMSSDAHKSSP